MPRILKVFYYRSNVNVYISGVKQVKFGLLAQFSSARAKRTWDYIDYGVKVSGMGKVYMYQSVALKFRKRNVRNASR